MKRRCWACGVEKDTAVLEVCPYPEAHLCDDPLPPLFVVELEPWKPYEHLNWKAGVVCHQCFALLDMDMWCSSNCWNDLEPLTPFEKLPDMLARDDSDSCWNVDNYHLAPEDEEKLLEPHPTITNQELKEIMDHNPPRQEWFDQKSEKPF